MDHQWIDEHNLAERYVLDKLTIEERDRFEEHYIECPDCVARVQAAEGLKHGLRQIAAETSGFEPRLQSGFLAWWSGAAWGQRAAIAAAVLVLIAPALVLSLRVRRVEGDLAREQLASAGFKQRENKDRERTQALASRLRDAESPVVERWEISRGREGTRRLTLSAQGSWIVLLLDLPRVSGVAHFRASIATPAGQPIWERDPLRQQAEDGLAISFPSSLLAPGDYVLTIDAFSGGRYSQWVRLPFRADR